MRNDCVVTCARCVAGALPNLVASNPKMVLSTVPTLQKTTHTFTTASTATLQTPTIVAANSTPVTNIVAMSRAPTHPTGTRPTVTFVSSKEVAANLTASKDPSQPIVTFIPGKEPTSNQSVPKDATPPTATLLPKEALVNQAVTIVSTKDSTTGKPVFTIVPQKEPGKEKDSLRINPAGLSFKDNTVTILSTKDVPPGSPITLISKDSASFAILSKEAANAKKLTASRDGGSPLTILSKETGASPVVVPAKDPPSAAPSQDSADPAKNILQEPPSVTIVSSKDTNAVTLDPPTDSSSVTVVSSVPDSSATSSNGRGSPCGQLTPSDNACGSGAQFTLVHAEEGGNTTLRLVPRKDVSETGSASQDSLPKQSKLTTLPFSFLPEMTVTTSEVPTIQYAQFQQIGKQYFTPEPVTAQSIRSEI